MNILVTAASRKVALVLLLQKALKKEKGRVIAADINPLSAALRFCDSPYIVPKSTDKNYIKQIHTICRKENISLIIPTIDEEIQIFADNKKFFQSNGITVLVPDASAARICYDKYETFQFFQKHNFPTPSTFLPSQIDYSNLRYPLFIKPRFGRGSENTFVINNEHQAHFFSSYVSDPIIQKYICGREFTLDVLTDNEARVLCAVPRERLKIRSGVSDQGKTVKDDRLISLAIDIATQLKLKGPSNIQCIMENDKNNTIWIIEINPRFSGAIQLTEKAGAPFTKLIVQMVQGKKITPQIGNFTDGVTMINYEKSIYLYHENTVF